MLEDHLGEVMMPQRRWKGGSPFPAESASGQQRTLAVTARSDVTLPWLFSCDPHHNLGSIECLNPRAIRRYFFSMARVAVSPAPLRVHFKRPFQRGGGIGA
jgi:hypothetical protein